MSFDLLFEPSDVLLFRDGRPFTAGEDTRARSLFPPTPFTVQGAIRARVLFSSGVDPSDYVSTRPSPRAKQLHHKIGAPGRGYGNLRLQGPLLARRENGQWTLYFPAPADVLQCEDGTFALLKPLKHSELMCKSNLPDNLLLPWIRTTGRLKEVRGWISEEDFRCYLSGQVLQRVLDEDKFVVREPRTGIALEHKHHTTREGHLYTAEFLRFKDDVALWVHVRGIAEQDLGGAGGLLQLGGEARAAYYITKEATNRIPPSPDSLPEYFKIILLTPAWFREGWMPINGDWSSFFEGSVELISVIVPRYHTIGGAYVDDRRRHTNFQKPMRRFVPAGSVFFFKGNGTVTWKGRPFTESPSDNGDYGHIGFGLSVIGNWDYA